MKIPGPGVFLSAPVLAEIAPRLLDLLEDQYRRDGVLMPEQVRKELREAAEVGMQWRSVQLAKAAPFRQNETSVDNAISSAPALVPMSYNAKQTGDKLGLTVRAVQYRASVGSIPATKTDGVWHFDAAAVDRLTGGTQ